MSLGTSSRFIVIRYPFHPLAGLRFLPVQHLAGPPATYRIALAERRLSVPAWMTEAAASEMTLCEASRVSFEALCQPG